MTSELSSSTDFSFDVFLSYNSKDKSRVRRLAERLKQEGLRVWFDEWTVGPGDIISLKVDEGLEQSRVLLLCISPNALSSGWVALERSTAIHRDPANEGRRFIPLLMVDCKLPDTLRRYKYVDLRKESDQGAAFAELLSVCRPEAAEAPPKAKPEPKKTPSKKKPHPMKSPEPTEPLAVLERRLTGHTGWVKSVAVSPDGKWAASGSYDHTIRILDLETGKCRATLEGHSDTVNAVAITPDGKRVLSCSDDRSIRIWDPLLGRELGKLDGHTSQIWSVAALSDNARALSGGWDRTLRLWDLASQSCIKTIERGRDEADHIFSSAVNPAGTQALSGHRYGRIRLWNLDTSECLATLDGHRDWVYSVQFTRDGKFAVSGSRDRTVKVWDLEARTCVGTLEGHQDSVLSVAFSPDGTIIASTGLTDGTFRLWDWKSGACLKEIGLGSFHPISVDFSPDGSRLVVGNAVLRDWDSIRIYRLSGVRAAAPAEATRRYVNAKVVLIGERTVGKTSLAHRLIED
ncbi:MAG: TIR domain-containing protein, partial [bacterium]|nr:TIR domain-containing protein [bacterium]